MLLCVISNKEDTMLVLLSHLYNRGATLSTNKCKKIVRKGTFGSSDI